MKYISQHAIIMKKMFSNRHKKCVLEVFEKCLKHLEIKNKDKLQDHELLRFLENYFFTC